MSRWQNELSQDPQLAGAVAEALSPAELPAELRARMRERVLQRLAAEPPARTLTQRSAQGQWLPVVTGVSVKILRQDPGTRNVTYLLRMQPGATLPAHEHSQDEECLVIEGELWMGDHVVRAGDWHVARAGSTHLDFRTKTGCTVLIRAEMRAFS